MEELFTPRIIRMNPFPQTMTSSLGTGGQITGNLEIDMFEPYTRMVHTDDGEIFRLDLCRITLVRYGYGASFQIGRVGRCPLIGSVHCADPSLRSGAIASVDTCLLGWVIPVRCEGLIAGYLGVVGLSESE